MPDDSQDPSTLIAWIDDSPPEPDEPPPSRTIAGYRLLRELGAGGMGTVYEAEQIALSRRVALKILAPHLSLSPGAVVRFRREAEAAGRQKHPGLVTVYDVGEEGGVHYIAQELVEGGRTLEDRLNRVRRLAQLPANYYRQTAHLVLTVADALQHAHESGVIHRDIKPSNILLTTSGTPKVTDFGLARMEDSLALSRTGDFAGTPHYSSPEQASAKPDAIDHRSDIFSLGITFYEALCFQRPFEGDTIQQVLHRVQTADPTDPRRIRAHIPPELAAICLCALEKRPEKRYASMAELAADLRRYLNHEPILARPPGAVRRARKWLLRHPVVTASGAVALVALLVVSGLLVQIQAKNRALQVEVATAQSALDFMTNMLESVDPDEARGSEVTIKEVLDRGAQDIASRFDQEPEVRARLMDVMGSVYLALGNYQDAEPLLQNALFLRETNLGREHADTMASRDTLAELRWRQARFSEAEELVRTNLQVQRRVLGNQHPDTLSSTNNLAALHWQQERYEEAEPLYVEALAGRRRVLGNQHPDTLETINNLAVLYKVMGRYEEAEPLYLEDLRGSRLVLGEDHPDLLVSLHNLATFYTLMQRYEEAEPLYLEALEGRRRVLGEDHPGTLNTMSKLGDMYESQGRYQEALTLFQQVLAGRNKVLGQDHPASIASTRRLADCYFRLGQLEQAQDYYLESLADARRILGDQNSLTARILTGLGDLYESRGQYGQAAPLYAEALATRGALLGEDHPDTIEAMANVALIHWRQGRSQQAETLYLQALGGAGEALGDEHSLYLNIANNLAALYLEQERFDKALPLYGHVRDTSAKVLGANHQLTIVATNNLASLHRRMGNSTLAETLYREAEASCRAQLVEHGPLLYKILNGLVLTLMAEGRPEEALPLAQEALLGNQELLGQDHPDTRVSLENLNKIQAYR